MYHLVCTAHTLHKFKVFFFIFSVFADCLAILITEYCLYISKRHLLFSDILFFPFFPIIATYVAAPTHPWYLTLTFLLVWVREVLFFQKICGWHWYLHARIIETIQSMVKETCWLMHGQNWTSDLMWSGPQRVPMLKHTKAQLETLSYGTICERLHMSVLVIM